MLFNLFLYLHWLGCLMNWTMWLNAPTVYFVQTTGFYSEKLD